MPTPQRTPAALHLRHFIRTLDERERALRERIEQHRDSDAAPSVDPTGDQADYALTREYTAMESSLMERARRELAQVEAARQRIEEGTYGECMDCGEPIGAARLEANPVALRCAACQERHERKSPPGAA
ncbi:MAG TPA: TraR/DksA family transcriptional regulator [Burkholderiales bacterium]|nr:TraR/DksA family transcriptional regulator [Burkholderiales bacterium]